MSAARWFAGPGRAAHVAGVQEGPAITHDYFQIFATSAVVMGVSHTIAREKIGAPLRERLGGKETWAGYLVSCPYCLSHWVAFMIVPLTGTYPLRIVYDWGVLSLVIETLLSAVFIATLAAFLRVVFYYVDETQGLVRRKQRRVSGVAERPGPRDAARRDGG